jgi:hypothetical protein
VGRSVIYGALVEPPTNEELGLDERGLPPTDESGEVDLDQPE